MDWTVHAHVGFEVTEASGGPRSITVDVSAVLSSIKDASLPEEFALYNNYPNPFNPVTNIAFDLPEATEVVLEIYNISGQKVAELLNSYQSEGTKEIIWNADGLASGIYYIQILSLENHFYPNPESIAKTAYKMVKGYENWEPLIGESLEISEFKGPF